MKRTKPSAASPLVPSKPAAKTRILLIEDHTAMRRGMRHLIERDDRYEVCAEAGNGHNLQALIETHAPHLTILDLSLPETNGFELTKQLRAFRPALPVLIVSMHNEEFHGERALQAGAAGYLMKDQMPEKLINALECVLAGKIYASDRLLGQLRRQKTKAAKPRSPA